MANALAVPWWLVTRFCHAIYRSSSKFKVIKTFLRSTMLQERRLVSLALLSRPRLLRMPALATSSSCSQSLCAPKHSDSAKDSVEFLLVCGYQLIKRINKLIAKVGICIESIFFSKCSIYTSFNCLFVFLLFIFLLKDMNFACIIFFKQLACLRTVFELNELFIKCIIINKIYDNMINQLCKWERRTQ